MGADLYRSGSDIIRKANDPAFQAACKHRNEVFEQAERERTIRYRADGFPWPDDCIAPPECVAAQQAVNDTMEAMQPPSHYFRDSYNTSSLFWKLDLSWWQDLEPLFGPNGDGIMVQETDEDGESYEQPDLYPAGMRKLIAELESRRDLFHANIADADEETQQYFRDKLTRLTTFLHDTAEAGDTIHCSL